MYRYFRTHLGGWFPGLRRIHRTTFVRQAANLWAVKRALWQKLQAAVPQDPLISVVDSFPVPVCRFGRAPRCRRFAGVAAFGHDEVAQHTFYGLRAHVRLSWPGVISDFILAPANLSDTAVAEYLLEDVQGWALGDRSYWKPALQAELRQRGLHLLAPFKSAKHEPFPYPRRLTHTTSSRGWVRYRIETVFGQLVERFHAKKIWARDLWHLTSRWMRKLLSHSIAVYFCTQHGLTHLSFAKLVSA